MGYTHYWYTSQNMDRDTWSRFTDDAREIFSKAKGFGLKIAGGDGTGEPHVDDEIVSFNGSEHCGHRRDERIVIPWPSRTARGIARPDQDAVSGEWFAGASLETRACNGNCSYETCSIERAASPRSYQVPREDGKVFDCCKTAYRPYDIVVTAVLLMLKHRFGDAVVIASDGEEKDWAEGQQLCLVACGVIPAIDFSDPVEASV